MKTTTKILLMIALSVMMTSQLRAQEPVFAWANQLGSVNDDKGRAITMDLSGNIITTGFFAATVDFDPNPEGSFNLTASGTRDVFLQKLDVNENFIWAKQIGGTDTTFGSSVTSDAAGNIIGTGYFTGSADFDPDPVGVFNLTSNGLQDCFVVKLNAIGNFQWAIRTGGVANDKGYSVTTDATGNVIITGFFEGAVDFNPGPGTFNLISYGVEDIFILKLDANGNFVWAKQMGGALSDQGHSVTTDAAGNILTAGDFSGMVDFNPGTATFNMTSNGYKDIFIQKLDLNGNFIFAKQIGGNISNDAAWSIKTDVFGNIITTGWFYGTVDFDPGKHTFNLISQFGDSYIEKLDGNGNFVWARGMTGSFNGIYSVTTDAGGNIYSTGFFNGTVDFNPSPASHSLTSHGSSDIYIHKLDVNGNFQWVEQLGGDSIDCGLGIVADAGGNLYATGFFSKNADFDPGFGTVSLISNGCVDMYIQKLGQTECTDIYEPNETQATAKTIAVNTDIRAMIGIATDIDWFKFSNTNKNKNIRITLANLPANYDVALFNAAGTQLGISQNTGNADEMITYNTSAVGTYYVKVYGSSGAYDPIACYKLKASIQQSSWKSLETAINDGEPATDLSVYPNPCKNLLNIEFNASSADKPSVKLTDMSGKIVRTCTFNAAAGKNIYTIDLSESGNGLYFLVLTTTDQSYFRKIIINR